MKVKLFPLVVLVSSLGISGLAVASPLGCAAGDPHDICPSAQYLIFYPSREVCPDGNAIDCVPVGQPPSPASLMCSSSDKKVVCGAWPRSAEAGLITYSWSFKGKVQTDAPLVSGSPQITGKCTAGNAIGVTVIMTSPGYASSTATANLTCNVQ